MEAPVHIAPAERADYEWCADLMASNQPWITLQRGLDACHAIVIRPGSDLFMARDKNATSLGFILLASHGLAGSPYIASIAVASEARGRGVGAQLLSFAEEHYKDRGHLFLLVSSFNHRAQQFYRRHRFERVGELKDYIVTGHSEFIFHKRLP
jgi:ribosomal protein S18 acetylase RimI-like enzyme